VRSLAQVVASDYHIRRREGPCPVCGFLGRPIDAYLNDQTFWTAVPETVWEYRIGGYQVIKKWLSYRSLELLGRPLSVEESRHVTNMARRLAIIVLMTDELNANYAACRGIE
jgi:Type ISP C-terminal specificity domain